MFTGIITHKAKVLGLSYLENQDLSITLEIDKAINRNLEIGCSVACNGVCLTLIRQVMKHLEFQASAETLSKTNIKNWQIGDLINIEFALRMGDELGGHLVSGHIDDVVLVKNIQKQNQDSTKFLIELPNQFKKFIAPKGSIVLNGVSLTINQVLDDCFSVNIIHHTFESTNFSNLKIGDKINLEIDMIARYLDKLTTHK
jgi:riboflavin synthase